MARVGAAADQATVGRHGPERAANDLPAQPHLLLLLLLHRPGRPRQDEPGARPRLPRARRLEPDTPDALLLDRRPLRRGEHPLLRLRPVLPVCPLAPVEPERPAWKPPLGAAAAPAASSQTDRDDAV